jgi:hypothetical protein
MGFREEFEDLTRWFRDLNPLSKRLLKIALLLVILLASGGFSSVLGPAMAALLWAVLSLETRSLSLSLLLIFGLIGFFGLMPAAALAEAPFMLLVQSSSAWAPGLAGGVEFLLIIAVLAGLCFWPASRLRWTAGLSDFAVLGVWLGAGMEAGMGFMQSAGFGSAGLPWGLWPQVPGLLGRMDSAAACASPLTTGLLAGLIVGLLRYLKGPDLGGRRLDWKRLAPVLLVLVWLFLERLAFASDSPVSGWGGFLYGLDLKGRLLSYLAGLAALVIIVGEWLLLQEHSQAGFLKNPVQAWKQAWRQTAGRPLDKRLEAMGIFQSQRQRQRELILAEEIRPLLSGPDQAKLEQRTGQIKLVLENGK